MLGVFLVDDHEMVRTALARLIDSRPDMRVVGQAATAEKAWDDVRLARPQLILCDLELPTTSGLELALRILEVNPEQAIVIMSYRAQPGEVAVLVQAGLRGYVTKSASSEELIRALKTVAGGGHYFSGSAATALAEATRQQQQGKTNPLSLRQTIIVQHMARGLTTKEIASELALSPKTVERHRSEILRRLHSRNQVEAIEAARHLQII